LETIRRLLNQFTHFVYAVLNQPGLTAFAAVFAVSFADAIVPVPGGMDAIVATGILATRGNLLYVAAYILIAASGNAAGNSILYGIGYKGGEVFLEKRLGREKFEAMRARFERHEILTLVVAGVMPPPFPFKALVFSAAVFEVDFWRFLIGILLGRLLRFSILAILVLLFGPEILNVLRSLVQEHLLGLLLSFATLVGVFVIVWLLKRRRKDSAAKANAGLPSDRSA
jgi:membrane protein YqaA with SNARE-associated domain